MNRILFRGFILFLSISGMLLLLPSASFADKVSEIQQELASKKASHAELEKKAKALNSEVTTLKDNLVSVTKDLQISEETLSETDLHLKDLRHKKTVYLDSLYKDQTAMGGLVSAARKYSQTSISSMLFQSRPIDAARAAMIMKFMIPNLHKQSNYLKTQLTEINKIEGDIANQLQLRTEQNKKLNKQQEALSALLEERNSIYQNTESQRQEQEKQVAVLTKESRNLEELMQKLKEKDQENSTPRARMSRAVLPANILFPVHGKLRIGFGEKNDLGAESKGLTFLTRSGARVVIPLDGTVKFAGAFQNYKQILIVEHQGGYHSLIAGLARIDTVVGASLTAGEPIGVAESSASPQIYYELRQNGKPVNPQKLLVAQRKQEKS